MDSLTRAYRTDDNETIPIDVEAAKMERMTSTQDAKRIRTGILFIVGAVLGYSILPVFTKNIMASGLEPVDTAIWRYAFAAPIFWLYTWLDNGCKFAAKPNCLPLPKIRLILMGTLLAAAALAAFFGLEIMPAGVFVVLFYTYPAMIAIMSLFLGDKLPLQAWIALGLTLVGVVLVTPDFSKELGGANLLGVGLAFLNAFIVAMYFILNGRILRNHPDKTRASAYIVSGALIVLAIFGVLQGGVRVPQGTTWLLLIGLASFSTVFPVFCLSNGIARLGASRASITGAFEPLLTSFWAMLFLGEIMIAQQWLGGVVIVAGVILLNLRRAPKPAASALKVERAGAAD
jgi:drug/metabolite transporter (DMT)-like permease